MMSPDEVKAWRKVERARLIAQRIALPIEQRRNVRTRVGAMLAAEVTELRHATIGFYWPFRGEIDLVGFVRGLIGTNSVTALPVVVEKGRPLEFWRWEPGMEMRPGIWDIPVPTVAEPVTPDCLLIRSSALMIRAFGSATAVATTTAPWWRCLGRHWQSASATHSSGCRPSSLSHSTSRWTLLSRGRDPLALPARARREASGHGPGRGRSQCRAGRVQLATLLHARTLTLDHRHDLGNLFLVSSSLGYDDAIGQTGAVTGR